jgi:ribosomal protein L28
MRQCEICHKGSRMGGERRLLRGHYNPVNWTRKYPNLQYARVEGKRMLICTQCLKTLHKKPVVRVGKIKIEATATAK